MAYNTQLNILEPVNLSEHLDKIELYLGQVCQIAGISKMQLDYWTNKAQIPTKGKKQRIYDIQALETVMLIKQAKDKPLDVVDPGDLGLDADALAGAAGSRVRSLGHPEKGEGAQILEGGPSDVAAKIADLVKEKVG